MMSVRTSADVVRRLAELSAPYKAPAARQAIPNPFSFTEVLLY
jgi:hypothetical protein